MFQVNPGWSIRLFEFHSTTHPPFLQTKIIQSHLFIAFTWISAIASLIGFCFGTLITNNSHYGVNVSAVLLPSPTPLLFPYAPKCSTQYVYIHISVVLTASAALSSSRINQVPRSQAVNFHSIIHNNIYQIFHSIFHCNFDIFITSSVHCLSLEPFFALNLVMMRKTIHPWWQQHHASV